MACIDVEHHPVGRGRGHGQVEGHVGGGVAVALVEGAGHVLDGGRHGLDVGVGAPRAARAAASPSSMRRSS